MTWELVIIRNVWNLCMHVLCYAFNLVYIVLFSINWYWILQFFCVVTLTLDLWLRLSHFKKWVGIMSQNSCTLPQMWENTKKQVPTLLNGFPILKVGVWRMFQIFGKKNVDNKPCPKWGFFYNIGKVLKNKYKKWSCLEIWVQVMGKRMIKS